MRLMPWDPEVADLVALVDRRTCEVATSGRAAPTVRPTSAVLDADRGLVTVTTSILLPAGVTDVRRDGRVALLFPAPDDHDARAADAPDVLVQGVVVPAPRAAVRTQPVTARGHRIGVDRASRRLADWYDRHVVLTVSPTHVLLRPAPPPASAAVPREVADGSGAFAMAARRLAASPSVLLAARDADGAPWLLRVRPVPDAATQTFVVDVPAGERVRPGPACLAAHGPDDRLWRLRGVVVGGDLARIGTRWVLTPHGRVPAGDASLPAAVVRESRRAARRALAPRPLSGPVIPGVTPMVLGAAAPRRDATGSGVRS